MLLQSSSLAKEKNLCAKQQLSDFFSQIWLIQYIETSNTIVYTILMLVDEALFYVPAIIIYTIMYLIFVFVCDKWNVHVLLVQTWMKMKVFFLWLLHDYQDHRERHTQRQTDRWTGIQTQRQTGMQGGRQLDRQTDRHTTRQNKACRLTKSIRSVHWETKKPERCSQWLRAEHKQIGWKTNKMWSWQEEQEWPSWQTN